MTSPIEISRLNGKLRSEQPNNSLYTFEATLVIQNGAGGTKDVPLGPDQMLLRGAQLRNTAWMYGLVVFTGHETKLMRNATYVLSLLEHVLTRRCRATPIKRTAVERMVNVQIIFLFGILLVLSFGSSIGSLIRTFRYGDDMWYLFLGQQGGKAKIFVEDVLTFIILYNNLIPIRYASAVRWVCADVPSLIVTMEVVKFQQAILINSDLGESRWAPRVQR